MEKINQFLRVSLIQLLYGYQLFVSPFLGSNCRFYPSCSNYAIDAVREYQIGKALYFILKRLLRCHPFHPGGYDPLL